jgi:catechol 2,3-dioxygenase-like lactoylglutathione lyase family enzyme
MTFESRASTLDHRSEKRIPRLTGIVETALDVQGLGTAIEFYHGLLGLDIIEQSERLCAFSVAGRDVLILFQREEAAQPVEIPGGRIPPHGSRGPIHFAFSVDAGELPEWEQWLTSKGVVIESRVNWERGGTSVYLRDPDGHLVELATPGLWSIY